MATSRTTKLLVAVCTGCLSSVFMIAQAADKSGVSPNTISLPGGPGSMEGLGESYQPSLNTGTPKYGIHIDLPPGTAGLAPGVSLQYEGGAPNGCLGFGWDMSLPYIQRQTDEGMPRYVDADNGVDDDGDFLVDEPEEIDVFINQSREEIVPLASGDYFCKNEGAFVRYRRVDDYWEGTFPDGTRMEFGISTNARIYVVDPDTGATNVFRWLCEREIDTHGNVIHYSYASVPDAANLNQKYCDKIEYGPGAPPWTRFHFVAFTYEARPDWFEDCRSGFRVRTGRRLKEIAVGTQGPVLVDHLAGDFNRDGSTDYLNRKYVLEYLDYAGADTHWTFLAQVQETGADGISTLPPTTFDYAVCEPPNLVTAATEIVYGLDEPVAVMDVDTTDLLDINADGLPDILQTPGAGAAHRCFINLGEVEIHGVKRIQWSPPRTVDSLDGQAWNFDLQTIIGNLAGLADMDGDGTSDFCYYQQANDTVHFFRNLSTNVAWGARATMDTQDSVPPSPIGKPNVTMGDFDFDKRTDILETANNGSTYRVWFNLGNQTYSRRLAVPQDQGYMLADGGVDIADFNGDRVPDFTRIRSSVVEVHAGLGRGRFAPRIHVPIPDVSLNVGHQERARLRDVNGDGLVDLMIERAQPGVMWYWINLGNYQFSSAKAVVGMPSGFGPDFETRWADMNGNGTVDLVYADSTSTNKILTVEIGRLIGCQADMNMLTQIRNGLGLTTTYEYDISTRFVVDDREAGRPWPDIMPFPMNVITKVIEDDSLGHQYQTQYRYHNGYYDETEKEFRGFGRVERVDVGDVTAPTLVSESVFDQGKQHEAMQGNLLHVTIQEEDGDVFSEASTAWVDPPRVLYAGINGEEVVYAFPVGETNVIHELGQGAPRTLESESAYDNYGNVTREAAYGIVEGGDRTAFDDERITEMTYAINTNVWIVQAPARAQVMDEHGVVISRNETYYDDPTFSGTNLGVVAVGDASLTRAWINPGQPTSFIRASRTIYDLFGNPVTLLDPLSPDVPDPEMGHYREVAYDPDFHAYAEKETIHVGDGNDPLVVQVEYDLGFGVVTRSTDMNGHDTTYAYDEFSRLLHTVRPGDSDDFPTTEYDYFLAVPFGPSGLVNYVESRSLDKTPGSAGGSKRDHYFLSRNFSDGLGRGLMTKEEAGPDPDSGEARVSVKEAMTFNARKGAHQQLNSFYSTAHLGGGGFDYESIEAPGWEGRFHESGNLLTLAFGAAHKGTSTYDAQSRPTTLIHPDGSFSERVYEPLVTRAFDENDTDAGSPHFQTPVVSHSDGLGRPIRADQLVRLNDDGTPAGSLATWSVLFQFDLNDMPTAVTDAQGNVKRMTYDGLTRMLTRHDPDQGHTTFAYDDASNLLERNDAKGQRITYSYDGVNRQRTEDYHDEGLPFSFNRAYDPEQPVSASNQPDVLYVYDVPTPDLTLGDGTSATARNTRGRTAYVIDLSGEVHSSYDERGRLEYEVKRVPGFDHDELISFTTRQAYDSLDRVVRLAFPDNDVINFAYNDRLLTARIFGDRAGDILSSVAYTPFGVQQECQYGNGTITRRSFDSRLRMDSLVTESGTHSPHPLIHYSYTFDNAANIDAISDLRPQVPATNILHNSQIFQYDDLYRLTRYQLTGPAHSTARGVLRYRYDRIGNMLHRSSPDPGQPGHIDHDEDGRTVVNIGAMHSGGSAGTSGRPGRNPGDPPGPGALTSTGDGRILTYDGNGNVTSLDGLTNTWDFKDRLVAVEDDSLRAEYTYDYADRRITKQVIPTDHPDRPANALTTIYVNPGFEVREDEQPTKFVFNGSARMARITHSLSSVSNRVQRLQVKAGWNLLSMAVQTPEASSQLGVGTDAAIQGCYRWEPDTQGYILISSGDPLPAGSVFWLKSSANKTLTVSGSYADPSNTVVRAGGDYIPSPGLEGFSPHLDIPGESEFWAYTSDGNRWVARGPEFIPTDESLPARVAPGKAVFVRTVEANDLQRGDPALQVRYHHQDHLRSTSVITGADGSFVEECAYYPFGHPRHRHTATSAEEAYLFTQKEKDMETGLAYFGARYYADVLAQWLSVDPSADSQPGLTPYHYVGNRALTHVDPDGRMFKRAPFRRGATFKPAQRPGSSQQRRPGHATMSAHAKKAAGRRVKLSNYNAAKHSLNAVSLQNVGPVKKYLNKDNIEREQNKATFYRERPMYTQGQELGMKVRESKLPALVGKAAGKGTTAATGGASAPVAKVIEKATAKVVKVALPKVVEYGVDGANRVLHGPRPPVVRRAREVAPETFALPSLSSAQNIDDGD